MTFDGPSTGISETGETGGGPGDRDTLEGSTADDESYRFLVSIHHPAQAHFYRYAIAELREAGHRVRVCVRDKEIASDLLEAFGIEHRVLSRVSGSLSGVALTQATYEAKLLREAWRFGPDVMTSVGGIEISHIAPLVGARALAFTDTPSRFAKLITAPSLDATCTPAAVEGGVRGEHRRYDGYQELAYLHPNRFEPDHDRLRAFGVDPDARNYLLRFVGWGAYHDVDERGLDDRHKRELVSLLSRHGNVYITSERELPAWFRDYELPVPPQSIHDLLAVSDLYVGDSGTMATEAALLGIPAVRVASVVADGDLANFVELEEEYGLLARFADGDRTIRAVEGLLEEPDLQRQWERRRERLLADKIDVTEYVVEQLLELGARARQEPHKLYE